MLRLKAEKKHMYWQARAAYRDKFDPDYVHVKEYCQRVIQIHGEFPNPNADINFTITPCKRHN